MKEDVDLALGKCFHLGDRISTLFSVGSIHVDEVSFAPKVCDLLGDLFNVSHSGFAVHMDADNVESRPSKFKCRSFSEARGSSEDKGILPVKIFTVFTKYVLRHRSSFNHRRLGRSKCASEFSLGDLSELIGPSQTVGWNAS